MADFRLSTFRDTVSILNKIDDGKLIPLTTRIATAIVKMEQPFSIEEQEKLEASLNLTAKDIDSAVKSIQELLKESAYHNITPEDLERRLSSLGLEPTKSNLLGGLWSKVMPALCDSLKNISVLPQMSHLSYNLSVETARDIATKEKIVKGQIHIGLGSDAGNETLHMEFTHDELYDFHNKLARIQSQLDAMADK